MQRPNNGRANRETRIDMPYIPSDHHQYDDGNDYADDSNRQPAHTRIPWSIIIGVGVAVFVALLAAVASPQQFKHQLAISFIRQPTPYTQLYFKNPGTLPDKLKYNKKNTIDFTIVNNEGRTYIYTYVITLQDSRSRQTVSAGTVTIANMHTISCPGVVIPKDRNSRYMIIIDLKGMNQSIHFYGETS